MLRALGALLVLAVGCTPAIKTSPTDHVRQPLASGGDLSQPRVEFASTVLSSGSVVTAGGFDGASVLGSTETWDPIGVTWTAGTNLGAKRRGLTATTLASGAVLFLGGDASSTGETWDVTTGAREAIADDGAMFKHAAALLASGDVLVVGGNNGAGTLRGPRLYSPSSNTWTGAGTMETLRDSPVAIHLADDRVILLGGLSSATSYVLNVEVYDPATNTWKSSGGLSVARAATATTLMADGRILVIGGTNGTVSAVVDIWDPSLGVGSATTSLGVARANAAAVTLPTGRVLVLGGEGAGGVLSTSEVFDPTLGTWTAGPALAGPRRGHQAVLVGGRVLVVGGHSGSAELKSTELFGAIAAGGACVIDEECLVGTCSGGVCNDGTDAGVPDGPPGEPPPISGTFQACETGKECPSGFCVENVCCNKACTGRCESCALPGSPGLCTVEPFGIDKKAACGAAGGCVGTCDGKGGCIGATGATQCAPVRCISATKGAAAAFCPSKGAACPTAASATFDCDNFICEKALGACRSTCSTSAHCAPGYACDTATRNCVAPGGGGDGGGCALGKRQGASTALASLLCVAAAWVRRRRAPQGPR